MNASLPSSPSTDSCDEHRRRSNYSVVNDLMESTTSHCSSTPSSEEEGQRQRETSSSSSSSSSSPHKSNPRGYGSTVTWTSSSGDESDAIETERERDNDDTTSKKITKSEPYATPVGVCPPFRVNPPSSTPEPFRDFDGPFTLYRLLLIMWILLVSGLFYELEELIWPPDPHGSPYTNRWYAQLRVSLILLTPLLTSALTLTGASMFRFPTRLDHVMPMKHKVVFRIVSRGINNDCLLHTIRACQRVMKENSHFPYLIEVVTDADVFEAPCDDDVIQLKVPPHYQTQNRTLFKARALHYACEASLVPNSAWIVHLDEETYPTSSGVKGITDFVTKCEATGDVRRVGQGCILYGRAWKEYRFLTLADMRRTGDDFGYFYLQHRLGVTLFGLHGAFVVCRADAEKEIGFDLGPEGSITEDAWWALIAVSNGNRFAWVDGFLEEQSTQSISDFLKQRRRWNYGLFKVVVSHPVRLRFRIFFIIFFLTWFLAPFIVPFQVGYVITLIVHDLGIPMCVRLPTLVIMSLQVWSYIIGWVINIKEGMKVNKFMIPVWTIILICLYPVFQVLECMALFMAFFADLTESGKGFHVVQKSVVKSSVRLPDSQQPLLMV